MCISTFTRASKVSLGVLVAAGLMACAAPGDNYQSNRYPANSPAQRADQNFDRGTEYGRVVSIYEQARQGNGNTSGAGAVIGAVVGGVLGNQIGGGSGRALATAAGAVGGAVAGNAVESRNGRASRVDEYRIVIALDQGGRRDYDVSNPGDLRVGDRVRLYAGEISHY